MLRYAAIFLIIDFVAAFFGFGGVAAGTAEIARVLFYLFLILFVASLVAGFAARK